jgi:LPS export ABC transporter protein LptC
MRRIPLVIVACVVVFLAVVTGVLVTRSRGAKAHPQEPSPSKADYRIKEVHLQEEDRGRGSWQLDADYGEIFEAQGKTYMKKVTIRINEPTRDWTVNSDEGDLLRDSKDVELRGHVVVVSSDGLRLETSRLNWMAKEQRVWTDQPVTIWRNGVVVKGQGFESGAKDGVTRIKGRVRATISKDQMARAEAKTP